MNEQELVNTQLADIKRYVDDRKRDIQLAGRRTGRKGTPLTQLSIMQQAHMKPYIDAFKAIAPPLRGKPSIGVIYDDA